MSSKRRVAITGLGLITPLGLSVQESWSALVEGKSGVGQITRFDASKLSVRIAAEVKGFTPERWIAPREVKKMGLFIQYSMAAGIDALANAGLKGRFGEEGEAKAIDPERVGICIAAGMGGLPEIEYWARELTTKEKKVTTPFFVPMIIPNMSSGQLSILTNAQGPNTCVVTACASSSHAIGESMRLIQRGDVDVMISGGSESVVCETGVSGFASMKALSSRNEDPTKASRPYDKDRDGFVLGEGAAILILEEWEHAKKRGATIYAEVLGYGLNSDAYHMTSPSPEGKGAEKCMRLALKDAALNPTEIGYVNTHGTSTPVGDGLEAQALARLFSDNKKDIHISSTKSMTGHLLGAAGAIEAAFSVLSLHHSVIPPTINLQEMDEVCKASGLNFTPNHAQPKKYRCALSNSFGFGGTNAALIFGKA